MSVPAVEPGFSPLDARLGLRPDSWSEGVARTATWLGATQSSYQMAAETFSRLTGGAISDTSIWRITTAQGTAMAAVLEQDAEVVSALPTRTTTPAPDPLPAHDPLGEHANVSLDGVLVLTREHSWREVKVAAVSAVTSVPPPTAETSTEQRARVQLQRHSYRAKRCSWQEFGPVVDAELQQRRVCLTPRLTSVNDGDESIWEVVRTVLSPATQVLDWSHAMGHIWKVAHAVFGTEASQTNGWVAEQETALWEGHVAAVLQALAALTPQTGAGQDAHRQVSAYLTLHAERMAYARFRAEQRPIGSGTVESAAKNVVQWRMKRGGQRWQEAHVNPLLAILGETHSGRFDLTWERAKVLT